MNFSPENSSSAPEFHPLQTIPADLPTLAAEINAEHEAAERTARRAIDHAKTAGDKLLLAKAQVAHGQWLPWLSANCPALAARTARSYMQLARNWTSLESKTADSANLSIDTALKLLNDPAPEPITGDLLPAYHDPITTPLLPATAAPPVSAATVAVMLAELPEVEQRIVLDTAVATRDLKIVRADAKYLHTSQNRHEWYTPAEYIDAAREVMGGIDLDPASCEFAQETVKADRFYSKDQDGLAQPWKGRVWLNPPFESALIGPFIAKLLSEYQSGAVQQAIVITNDSTDTTWFHELATAARVICFTKGRVKFQTPIYDPGNSPQRGNAFTYLGDRPNAFVARFKPFGLVMTVMEGQP